MAKPVRLSNGRFWPTQTAAKAHFKKILNELDDGERVTDSSNHSDLCALVQSYDRGMPVGQGKSGNGIDHFFKDRDREHNGLTSCFYVARVDKSSIDFSYLRAVELLSKNPLI